jgi:micrococcal nuclease
MRYKMQSTMLLILWLLGSQVHAADTCMSVPKMDIWVKPSIAFSGDTLMIQGKQVKLIGISAPALQNKHKFYGSGQPLAPQSQTFLNKLIANNGMDVGIVYGKEKVDKFKHLQAYVYFKDGSNAQQRILEAGMAIAMPSAPNTRFVKCLAKAEQVARSKGTGVWGVAKKYPQFHYPIVSSDQLYSQDIGYRIITGKVVKVETLGKHYVINLDTTGIRVPKKYWSNFNYDQLKALEGKQIEVRGFGIQYNQAMFMTINTPYAIDLLANEQN